MLLHNGQLLPEADFALPLPNRGLFFNDGFFETMVWAAGAVRYLPQHLARMQQAAAALGLELPAALATAGALMATLGQLVATQTSISAEYRVRLQLWRGGGGLYTPETEAVEWLATSRPFHETETAVTSCGFAETVRTQASPVSFCKGPNALTYVLAARERQHRNLDELLLLDAAGHVAESVAAAVFWLRDGQLFTPSLETGCVAGVRRAHLLQVARQQGLAAYEVLTEPAGLLAAEAVFTANVAGIKAVRHLGATRYAAEHPLLVELRRAERLP
ncbi:aminotransferase class IV [Hymenobacter psychrotolerans]|uniref:branched-chain-amino-acid transaminase n=1 Tax=Hymenobacter psychrotolerans DSM 18569 TaxID=1121959 RepID=A0A1M7F8B2_9BACT|nr:aminotransferase class IV [Hymenobacter psychrotolerans]SHM00205.1 branched-chain amino acid aminotransferase [Hymenobacter psychrotolerans DSM 18569]